LTFSPEKLHSDVNQQMNISNITKRIDHGQLQARNQLGTPVETKSFLRGAQIICRTHFFRGEKIFPWGLRPLRATPSHRYAQVHAKVAQRYT